MQAERLEKEFDIDIEWRPFELHPEIPPEGRDIGDVLSGPRAAYFQNVRAMAENAGLTFEPATRLPNSHRPLEAAEFAREHGQFSPYHAALFEAYFSRGRDVGDLEVLAELGEANGLDGRKLREAIESRRYARAVDESTRAARQEGITGTPTFVFEIGERRFPIVGAQEYAVFENVARRMGAVTRTENQEPRTTS